MKLQIKITDHESVNPLSDPPPSGTYALICTKSEETIGSNTNTQGVNMRFTVVSVDENDKKYDKRSFFFTFWLTDKTMGRFRNFCDTVGVSYSDDEIDVRQFVGKGFRGRVSTYEDENWHNQLKCDLQTWTKLNDQHKRIVDSVSVKIGGDDKPPSDMGKSNKSPAQEVDDDDDLPF